jgi:hypothetical protein
MSTKTTFKRIALVAVAALGFGVLTSVAPASAVGANDNITAITAGTSAPARVGVLGGKTTITLTHPETTTPAYTESITAQIVSAPATSVNAVLTFSNSSVTAVQASSFANTSSTKTDQLAASMAGIATALIATTATDTGKSTQIALSLNADVAGSYQILVTANATAGGGFTAGKKSTSYTITTAGTPTAVAITRLNGAIVGGAADDFGLNLAISLKDAAGNATVLGLNESLDVSQTAAVAAVTLNDAAVASTSFGSSSATSSNAYVLRAEGKTIAAAGTNIITVTGGGVLPATLTQNYSATMTAAVAGVAGTFALTTSTGTAVTTGTTYTGSAATWNTATASSHTFKFTPTTQASTATNYAVNVTDKLGVKFATHVAVPAAATATVVTDAFGLVTVSSGVDEDYTSTTIAIATATNGSQVISYDPPTATKATVTVPATNILAAPAAATAMTVKLVDEYGNAMANRTVSVSVSGRNTVASKELGVTDSLGQYTWTHTDAGTTGATDSVVFVAGGVTATAFTITYGTFTVSKVSFTGGSTTAGVANATPTVHALEADQTPESATQDAEVTVTDAAGSLLAGVPVTFTVAAADAAKLALTTTTATVYTGSNGKATGKVYAWIAGTYTVTATAGGVTGTGTYTFANNRPADARVLSASATDGVVTAKVVDRFGNPVSGVTVYASRTSGTGYFGSGVSKTSTTTGTDGVAEFTMVGTAEVKVSTLDYNALPGTNAAGQTCALAGNFDCAVGATAAVAFTATTAGTAIANAKNVGSSFAPAGVSSVTVAVNNNAAADSATAAADAAAEATDAANAATDAANAAAEAADAATAAAQDAADAVAALSTQVSEMVDALKKQITALTNLVIKIQKKVRA